MSTWSSRRPRRAAGAAVAAAGALALATPAAALEKPAGLTHSPGSPSPRADFTFSWGPPPDATSGFSLTYRATWPGGSAETTATSLPVTLPEGRSHIFSVTATETDPATGAATTGPAAIATVTVDLTEPRIVGTISPASPNGRNGWYTRATVRWTCTDAGSGIASCPPTEVLDTARADRDQNGPNSIQSPRLVLRRTTVDQVGWVGAGEVGPIKFDALAPTAGQPKQPGVDARLAAEPKFVWSRAGNDTSGVDRYEVWVQESGRAPRVVATVPHSGASEFSAPRSDGAALETLTRITWWVRSHDVAGNSRDSGRRSFTIDPTVPPPPRISEGPVGPTRVTSPAFTWSGAPGATFRWDLTLVTEEGTRVVQEGSGTATRATFDALPDGVYVFRVTELSGVGVVSEEATRNFDVDTTAPAPPAITRRPTAADPTYAWTTEFGASSRWYVTDGAGAMLGGVTDTFATTASVAGRPAGEYGFGVKQVDPAGNVSAAATDRFSVRAAVVAGPTRRPAALPHRNAGKLRPKPGAVVTTRTPLLRWAKGPAGTRLYNVQLFLARRAADGRVHALRKILSSFPRARRLRLPARKVRPGSCYVWRVWPYRTSSFTPRPLGISNFCVAKASVIRRAKARS